MSVMIILLCHPCMDDTYYKFEHELVLTVDIVAHRDSN